MTQLQRLGMMSAILLLTACGKTGTVSIKSESYATSGASSLMADRDSLALVTPSTNVSDFKICVKRIRLQDEDGEAVSKDGETGENGEKDVDDIRFSPGLIDLTDGLPEDWGKVEVPVGFKLSRLTVKVKKDESVCGVNYSVKFNSASSPQDIEFKFKFDPAVELSDGSTLNVSMAKVVEQLRLAVDSGDIASMKERIEAVEGAAQ
jgi:hypothetical protein